MSHANAALTPRARELVVDRFLAGWPKAHIAKARGCSRKCVAHWIDVFQEEGLEGLQDRSSRPHASPTRTPEETGLEIVRLRIEERLGGSASPNASRCRRARSRGCSPDAGRRPYRSSTRSRER